VRVCVCVRARVCVCVFQSFFGISRYGQKYQSITDPTSATKGFEPQRGDNIFIPVSFEDKENRHAAKLFLLLPSPPLALSNWL